MAVNEQIVTGRKFRKLIDETNKLWQRISFWTKSSDVEFNDGKNAETKLGAINGITSDLSCEDSSIAASAAALNQVNRNFQDGCNIIMQAVTSKGQTPASNSPADIAEAINKIATKGNLKNIATMTVSSSKFNSGEQKTISLKSYSNYSSLTINDIVLSCKNTNITQDTYAFVGYISVRKSAYNATSGTLTVQVVNCIQKETGVSAPVSVTFDVYVVE